VSRNTELVAASAVSGLILLVSGTWLAAVTPDDAPWIGFLIVAICDAEQVLGGVLLLIGIWLCLQRVFVRRVLGLHDRDIPLPADDVPKEERDSAEAQRRFNPPYAPKPDWGQTLRNLGLFAVLVSAVWYLEGASPVGGHELTWLREGFDAYGSSLLILAGTILSWAGLTGFICYDPDLRKKLELPFDAVCWLLRQIALLIGAMVLALITGAGVSAFPALLLFPWAV
jgi:hypothetical protein